VEDVVIKNVETGILLSDLAYYNELLCPVIFDAATGIKIVNGANENHIFGGRIQNVKFGVNLDDVSNPQIYGTCIEHFSIGIKVGPKTVSSPKIIGSRLENKHKRGIGISIASTTQALHIIGSYFQGLSTNIEDLAQDSNIISDQHWQIGSNTIIKQHRRMIEFVKSTTVGKQSAMDHTVQFNIVEPENYSLFVTSPPSIQAGLLVSGIPTSDGIIIRITNITMDDVTLPDSKFVLDIWRH
jgi:Periplasmic copper-binding protein (NosD)